MTDEQLHNFEMIRKQYGVPAYRGGRVMYTGGPTPKQCTIVGSNGSHLSLRDAAGNVGRYHPTWELKYLDKGAYP